MKERFSQLGIVSDFEFLVGEEAEYEVGTVLIVLFFFILEFGV